MQQKRCGVTGKLFFTRARAAGMVTARLRRYEICLSTTAL